MPNHGFQNQMCNYVEELKLRILHGLPFALGNFFVHVFTHTFDSGVSLHSWRLWPTVRHYILRKRIELCGLGMHRPVYYNGSNEGSSNQAESQTFCWKWFIIFHHYGSEILRKSLYFNILSENLTDSSTQQQQYCHVQFLLKFFDQIANKKKFLKKNTYAS